MNFLAASLAVKFGSESVRGLQVVCHRFLSRSGFYIPHPTCNALGRYICESSYSQILSICVGDIGMIGESKFSHNVPRFLNETWAASEGFFPSVESKPARLLAMKASLGRSQLNNGSLNSWVGHSSAQKLQRSTFNVQRLTPVGLLTLGEISRIFTRLI